MVMILVGAMLAPGKDAMADNAGISCPAIGD